MTKSASRTLAILGGPRALPGGLAFVYPRPPSLDRLKDRIVPMLESGRLTNNGPYVRAFEAALARRLDVAHCVAVANATIGLMLVPWVWKLSGEVIVPSFTFSASVHALVWNRLTPVFVDIDPRTLTLDPEAVEAAVSKDTSAIMSVNIFGTPPDLGGLEAVARRHHLRLLCDTAQGFGTLYDGRWPGSFGDAEVLSFHASKVLPTGEGGAIVTNDAETARLLRLAINFGNPGSGDCELVGLNGKMMEWSALLGLEGLETIEQDLAARRSLWQAYQRRLGGIPGVTTPQLPPGATTANGQNVAILVESGEFGLTRDELEQVLVAEGIECKKYFDPPAHRMRAYASVPVRLTPMPHTDIASSRVLCLPIHPHMTPADVDVVCGIIEAASARGPEITRQLSMRGGGAAPTPPAR
jgi:dTDP-4-amino-4,6-dideoxygalactose transaminase